MNVFWNAIIVHSTSGSKKMGVVIALSIAVNGRFVGSAQTTRHTKQQQASTVAKSSLPAATVASTSRSTLRTDAVQLTIVKRECSVHHVVFNQ